MQALSPSLPAPAAFVRRGRAMALAPSTERAFAGGALRIAQVRIAEPIAYSQYSERHLLHVTLSGRTAHSAGRIGRGDWIRAPDRRGSISFTPGGRERDGAAGAGEILGLEIELDPEFVAEACEQRLGADWAHAFNAADAKAFAIAELAAAGGAPGQGDRLTLDMLQLALARHVGRSYGGADRRRDDGWLHPAALSRVIERLAAAPAGSVALDEMARIAGLGVSAFVRAFRGSTGTTPAAFARRLRVDRAAELLRTTDLGLGDIAASTGFASAAHLVRTFRGHRGITPGRLRRQAGADGAAE